MKEKIGEVSRIFDISAENLRYLEKQGLIHPARDPENSYREFSLDDYGALMNYMRYRNMGLSVKDVVKVFHAQNMDSICKLLRESKAEEERKMEKSRRLAAYLEALCEELELLPYRIGRYDLCRREPICFIHAGASDGGNETYSDSEDVTRWRKQAPYVTLGYFVSAESAAAQDWHVPWIMQTAEENVGALGLRTAAMSRLSQQLCLRTYVGYSASREALDGSRELLAYARREGYEADGEVLATLLANLQQEGKNTQYTRLTLPIRAQTL